MGYRIESNHKLESDLLPSEVFSKEHSSRSSAIAFAVEGVDYPEEMEVRVIDTISGETVWLSTEEEYE